MSLIALCDTISKKNSLSKSFCSLGSGFHRAKYDASKFFLVLPFLGAVEIIVHLKTKRV